MMSVTYTWKANTLIDKTHAVLPAEIFRELDEYSCSIPTGVYEGKGWKAYSAGKWWLCWYREFSATECVIESREILVVETDQ